MTTPSKVGRLKQSILEHSGTPSTIIFRFGFGFARKKSSPPKKKNPKPKGNAEVLRKKNLTKERRFGTPSMAF